MVKWVKRLLQLAGVLAVAFGVLADFLLPGSAPGIGLRQGLIILVGAGLVALGRANRTTIGRLRHWATDAEGVMSPWRIVLLAVIIGAATGVLETLVLGIDRFAFHGIVRVGPHLVWMAPLLDTAILTTVGLLLWLASRLWPKLATPAAVTGVMLILAADAVLHRFRWHPRLLPEAKVVLIFGLAAALTPPLVRALTSRGARLRRGALAALLLVAVLGTAAAVYPTVKERRAYAELPDASAGAPNILLIILDTVRAASLSLYGYHRPTTPQLDRFARSGVVFDLAVSPSSWTLPSHGTFFTGHQLRDLQVDWLTPLDERFPTIAERLADAGYATAGFSANVGYVSAETGLARGFARFEDFVPTAGEAIRTSVMLSRVLRPFGLQEVVEDDDRGRRTATDISDRFLRWIDSRPSPDRPFFAFLNYFDAHAPFYAAAPYDTLFGGPQSKHDLRPWRPNMAAEDVREWIDAYDRSLVYVDAELGALFAELERRGTLDRTYVIVTSDHGELLGEHSFMGHATTLYRPVIEVPLVVRGPGVPAGRRVPTRVGLTDLAATLLDLSGTPPGPIPGRSLAAAWRGSLEAGPVQSELGRGWRIPKHYPNADHDLWSLFAGDLHYILSSSGAEELYRLSTDPGEERNLAAGDSVPPAIDRMRATVQALRTRAAPGADHERGRDAPER